MSADKRSVSTDALATLGTLELGEGAGRDAIHIAVEPVVSDEKLFPGQHVGLVDGRASTRAEKLLGIVDPYLLGFVPPGEKFWLLVYPRQITSLRHVWSHPDFEEKKGKVVRSELMSESEQWLRDWCERNDCPGYEIVMAAINGDHVDVIDGYGSAYSNMGDYIRFNGRDAHCDIPAEFWEHAERVLGRTVLWKPEFFSCTC